MANVKTEYAASSNLDVTSLNGLAASSTHVAGWESALIDNTTDKFLDYLVSAKLTVESTGVTAGELRVHIVAMLDDSTWPDVFDGTQSAETVTDANQRDAICKLGAACAVDTTASQVYFLGPFSVASLFGGACPAKFVVFITQSSGTTLETSGNQVTIKGHHISVT